jgi:DNA-binding transcriptional ArsR family regulator
MDNKLAVSLLASIAQEARLEIFRLLVQAGPEGIAAGAVAERLAIPASTLSFHLKELAHAGLAEPRQQGRFIYYSANYKAMENLLAYLTENCCAGQQDCSTDLNCKPKAKKETP